MFASREQAGEVLGELLSPYRKKNNVVVVGIARGGVVVASVIAKRLSLSLLTIVVKKIGSPANNELAIGAIGPDGVVYWDRRLIKKLELSRPTLLDLRKIKKREQQEKEKELGLGPIRVQNKEILLVDDGVATGSTVYAAIKYLKNQNTKKIILVTPVIAQDTYTHMKKKFHAIIASEVRSNFQAVGQFYHKFPQVSDKTVIEILRA